MDINTQMQMEMSPATQQNANIQQQHDNFRFMQMQQQQQYLQMQRDKMLQENQFMQQRQLMSQQIQQSQVQGISSPFVFMPNMQSLQNMPNSINSFANSQLYGVVNGLGLGGALNTLQAIGGAVATPINSTTNLISSLMNANYGYKPLSMSGEQRDLYARQMSYNMARLGVTVADGAATVAGGAAGLYAFSKVAKSTGYARAFGITTGVGLLATGAKWGAEKLTTNPWIAAMNPNANIAGIPITGLNPNIWHPFDYAREELDENKQISDYLSQEAYRFLSPKKGRSAVGMGLDKKEIHSWAQGVRGWDSKFHMKDDDIRRVLATSVDNGLINNVSNLDDFEDQFGRQVKYIKNASKILNKSYEEVAGMIGEFKRAGIDPNNFDLKAAEIKSYAGLLGKSVDAVSDYMKNVAKMYVQGTTMSGSTASNQWAFNATLFKHGYEDAVNNGDTGVKNIITNSGGPEGASIAARKTTESVLSTGNSAVLLKSLVTPDQNGNFTLDKARLSTLYTASKEGKLTPAMLTEMSNSNSSNWSSWQMQSYLTKYQNLFLDQDENTVNKTLGLLINTNKNSELYKTGNNENLLTSMYGLDAGSAKLLETGMNAYEKYGLRTTVETTSNPYKQLATAIRENWAYDRSKGGYWSSTAWMDDLMSNTVIGMSNSWEDKLTDAMNSKSGMPPQVLSDITLPEYIDLSKKGMAKDTVLRSLQAADINNELYDYLNRSHLLSGSLNYTYGGNSYATNRKNVVQGHEDFTKGVNSQLAKNVEELFSRGYQSSLVEYGKTTHDVIVSNTSGAGGKTTSYDNFFNEAAVKYGVNANVLKAMAQIESTMNPNSVSEKGALGLMQVMPFHATNGENLLDPYTNVMKGSEILSRSLNAYGGNAGLAAAAYNAGNGGLAKAFSKAGLDIKSLSKEELGSFDLTRIMQYLPGETQHHIKKYYDALRDYNVGGINSAPGATGTTVIDVAKTFNVSDYSVDKDLINSISSAISRNDSWTENISSKVKADLIKYKDEVGFITRKTEELTKPTSIDVESLTTNIDNLQTVANDLAKNGVSKASDNLESALSYLKTMKVMDVNNLSDVDITRQIDNLNKVLSSFKGNVKEETKKVITDAIDVLNSHKTKITTVYDTVGKEQEVNSIREGMGIGIASAERLPLSVNNVDQAKFRGDLKTNITDIGTKLAGAYSRPLGTVSSEEIVDIRRSYADLNSKFIDIKNNTAADTLPNATSNLILNTGIMYQDKLNALVQNKVNDIARNAMENEPAFSPESLNNYAAMDIDEQIKYANDLKKLYLESLNKASNATKEDYTKNIGSYLKDVNDTQTNYQESLNTAVKTGKAHQKALENAELQDLPNLDTDIAKMDVTYRLNNVFAGGSGSAKDKTNAQLQLEYIGILKKAQEEGNFNVLKGYTPERMKEIITAANDSNAPDSVKRLIDKSPSMQVYVNTQDKIEVATATPKKVVAPEDVINSESVEELVINGKETQLFKDLKSKLINNKLSIEDMDMIHRNAMSSSPQAQVWAAIDTTASAYAEKKKTVNSWWVGAPGTIGLQNYYENKDRLEYVNDTLDAQKLQKQLDDRSNVQKIAISPVQLEKYFKEGVAPEGVDLHTLATTDMTNLTKMAIEGTKKLKSEAQVDQTALLSKLNKWEQEVGDSKFEGAPRPTEVVRTMLLEGRKGSEIDRYIQNKSNAISAAGGPKISQADLSYFRNYTGYTDSEGRVVQGKYGANKHQTLPAEDKAISTLISRGVNFSSEELTENARIAAIGSETVAGLIGGMAGVSNKAELAFKTREEYVSDDDAVAKKDLKTKKDAFDRDMTVMQKSLTELPTSGISKEALVDTIIKNEMNVVKSFGDLVMPESKKAEVQKAISDMIVTQAVQQLTQLDSSKLNEQDKAMYDAAMQEFEAAKKSGTTTEEGVRHLVQGQMNVEEITKKLTGIVGDSTKALTDTNRATELHAAAMNDYYDLVSSELVKTQETTEKLRSEVAKLSAIDRFLSSIGL